MYGFLERKPCCFGCQCGLVGKDIVGYLQVIRTEQANAHSMDEMSVLLLRPEGFMGVL